MLETIVRDDVLKKRYVKIPQNNHSEGNSTTFHDIKSNELQFTSIVVILNFFLSRAPRNLKV